MINIYAHSDIGVTRDTNQDRFWVAKLEIDGTEAAVVCLCDGMGGLTGGEYAAESVVSVVREFFSDNPYLGDVVPMLEVASTRLYEEALRMPVSASGKKVRMGTTCTLLFMHEGEYTLFHVGDSRAYKLSEGNAEKLTTDHTGWEKAKERDPEAYVDPSQKNKLYNCMGALPRIFVQQESGTYSVGDKFLLASDGFWHFFQESGTNLAEAFRSANGGNLADLVAKCIRAGERDNITAAVVEVN